MILRKSIRRDILFFLATLVDTYNEYSYATLAKRVSYMGYQPKSVTRQLYRMTQIGDIEKVAKGGKPHYRLTTAGHQKIKENISLFGWQERKWQGWWCLVIFDINEEQRYLRDWLRRKLERLGFGQWQKSVYISPHDLVDEVNRFLEVKKMTGKVACLKAKQDNLKTDKELAYQAWKLDKLWDEYSDFIQNWTTGSGGKRIELWAQYQTLIEKDPFLPKKLLPENWPAYQAHRVFKQYLKKSGQS